MNTLAAVALPQAGDRSLLALLRTTVLVVGFSLFVALCAQISVRLWPVPVTAQTLGVLLTGAVLGPRLGTLAMLAYIGEGLMGLPVFSNGQSAWSPTPRPGVPFLFGTTVGYIVGFVVAAGLVGWLAQRGWDRSVRRAAVAMIIGQVVIYAFGLANLLRFLPLDSALAAGLFPFLPGDALKIALAALALPGAWSLVQRR